MKILKRDVFLDCLNLMKGTIILSIISTVAANYVDIFTATTLGNFTTSILSGNTSLVTNDIIKLTLLIISSVVMIPTLLLLKNTFLFKECLKHDRMVQSHFLEKDFLSTRKYSSGEISHRLEEDLIDYRFIVIDLLSAPIIILITALPLYSALSQNFTYGLVCVLFSSLPLIIALISRNIETHYSLKDKEYKDNLWSKEIELISCYSYIKQKDLTSIMLQRFRNIFSLYYRNTATPNIRYAEIINFLNDLSDHGSGKSTLIKILSGLYRSFNGKLNVNGVDVSEVNIHSLRQRISYIEQDPHFFKGTIRENLLLADSSKSDESLRSMLKLVNLDKSLDDIIELNSSNLSGGEKQKLSIARALLKDSDVLIFDEPTNNLDKETKEIVRNLIKTLDKSIIFISHDKDLLDTSHMYLEL